MVQRRDFVRLKKRLEVEYKEIIERFASTAVPPNTSYTDTISGNGMSMFSPKCAAKKTRYEMVIKVPSAGDVNLAAEVLDCREISKGQFELILKFVEVDEPERDKLVKYIMREGVKAKPKGKK